jgi:hypothetical protein
MVMIETRDAAREKAYDLVEEGHELGHEMKMVLCELEDTLYDCFEEDKEETEKSSEGTDLGFKSKYNRHYAMRNFDDGDEDTHQYRRNRAMRMRRNKLGRFA